MNDFIPLFQTLVWPIFILALIFYSKKQLFDILDAIKSRIVKGDSFEAGSSGIKLGSSTGLAQTIGNPPKGGQAFMLDSKSAGKYFEKEQIESKSAEVVAISAEPSLYVVHRARRDKSLDRGEYEYYRLKIYLEADSDADLNNVTKVIYHLHPSFANPDREIINRETQFELTTSAWGQFNLTADVYLKGQEKPVTLERYLNF